MISFSGACHSVYSSVCLSVCLSICVLYIPQSVCLSVFLVRSVFLCFAMGRQILWELIVEEMQKNDQQKQAGKENTTYPIASGTL